MAEKKDIPVIPADQRRGGVNYPGDKVVRAWLFHDIEQSDTDHLAMLLQGYPEARDFANDGGASPLLVAIRLDKLDMLRWLLTEGAMDIDSPSGAFGTPLQFAIRKDKEEAAVILAENGARLENLDGKSAWEIASEKGLEALAEHFRDENLRRLKDHCARDFMGGTAASVTVRKPLSLRAPGR